MTKACNLNCKYCFMLDRPKVTKDALISQELLEQIVDQIAAARLIQKRALKWLTIVLHGGEPLLLPPDRLEAILNYIATTFGKYGILYNLSIQTNATLLNEEYADILARYEVHVGLSFDGIEGANDSRTSIKQSAYEKTFKLLDERGVRYGFIMVASKGSIDQIDVSKRYLESLPGVDSYKVNYSEDMINPGVNSEIEIPGDVFFEKASRPEIERVIEYGRTYDSIVEELIRDSLISIMSHVTVTVQTGCESKSCGSSLHMIAIEPTGDMDICDRFSRHFDDPIINVQHALDYDFLAVNQIAHALMFHEENNRALNKTRCDTCPADFMCKHGCMSFHYSKFNQQWGTDTFLVCSYYKAFYAYMQDNLIRFLKSRISMGRVYEVHSWNHIDMLKPHMIQYLHYQNIQVTLYQEYATDAEFLQSVLEFKELGE